MKRAPRACGAIVRQSGDDATSARGAHEVACSALHVPLHCGSLLSVTLLRRLVVEFAPAKLGEHARLLARSLKAPQGGIEVFILAYTHTRHRKPNLLIMKCFCLTGARLRAAILIRLEGKRKMRAHGEDF